MMTRSIDARSGWLLLGLTLVVGACGAPADAPVSLRATVDTVDGVKRLGYPETGAPQLAWRLDTAAVIGGYGAESEEYQFDQVNSGSLAGDRSGALYVIDRVGMRVLGYDTEGAFMGSWGREGSGPGELQMPVGLGVGQGDTLWVLDGSHQRITLLPTDSDARPASIPFPPGSSMMGGRIIPVSDGAYGVFAMFSFRPG
ncbi:MAG: hypothetical protein KJO06_09850, partial [Gemmatimonadetes bacterium]|nr:hypothetical protein [Gemmatimonadota bacterium]